MPSSNPPFTLSVGMGGRWGLLVARRRRGTVYTPHRNSERVALWTIGGNKFAAQSFRFDVGQQIAR